MKVKWKRLIALILIFSLIPLPEMAARAKESEEKQSVRGVMTETYINPLYADVIHESDLVSLDEAASIAAYAEEEYLTEIEECAVQIREGMKQREETIVVYYQAPEYSKEALVQMIDQAVAHTGNPSEGDYLRWQYAGAKSSTSYYTDDADMTCMTITFTFTYYTTNEQETKVDEKLEDVLSELNVTEKSDYEKIRAIYDYICEHTAYDYDNLEDDDYTLKYTAYAALIDGKAVCQGYAVLFYRMALELNVDSRLIPGEGNGEAHGWNIVELEDQYYNVDSTWDAGKTEYQYFLKCDENFVKHTRDEEYTTEEFYAAYPMAEEDYVTPDVIASGTCGEDLTWTLDNKGLLNISGTGAMNSGEEQSIFENTDSIQKVIIQDGVTSISDYAFYQCTNLQSIEMADSVAVIGKEAFGECTSLSEVAIPAGVTEIGNGAWSGCGCLTAIDVAEDNSAYTSIDGVLFTEDQKTLIAFPGGKTGDYDIPEGTELISEMSFSKNQSPGAVTVPASVVEIESWAFAHMEDHMSSIYFYGDAPTFGTGVFEGTTTTINYPDRNETWEKAKSEIGDQEGSLTWSSYAVSLDTPLITSVFSRNQTSVKVTWEMVEGADGYELYRAKSLDADGLSTDSSDEENGMWIRTKTINRENMDQFTNGGSIQYTNQKLEIGQTYYYKVRAYQLNEESEDIEELRDYSEFSEINYMPAAVVYDNVYSNSTSRIRMIWKEVSGAHGYQLWRKETGADDDTYKVIKTIGDKNNILTDNQGSTTAYSNTGLEAGKSYTYKMRAFCIPEDGTKIFGAYSDEIIVAVMPETPDVLGESSKTGRAELKWNEINGAAGYQVWMADSKNGSYSIVKSITEGRATSYTKYGLTSKKTYYFKVRAYTEVEGKKTFGEYSSIVSIRIK